MIYNVTYYFIVINRFSDPSALAIGAGGFIELGVLVEDSTSLAQRKRHAEGDKCNNSKRYTDEYRINGWSDKVNIFRN